jgi:hypothetical protein
MGTVVVWDCETDTRLPRGDPLSREQAFLHSQITVACALVFKSEELLKKENWDQALATATWHTFWRDKTPSGETNPYIGLIKLFDEAESIVAYNGLGFDFRMLRKWYPRTGPNTAAFNPAAARYQDHRMKCLDPMLRIAEAMDIPYPGLDRLLRSNNLGGKTGDGLQAIKMWEEGRREELEAYCKSDVDSLAKLVYLPVMVTGGQGVTSHANVGRHLLAQRALQPVLSEDDWAMVTTDSLSDQVCQNAFPGNVHLDGTPVEVK